MSYIFNRVNFVVVMIMVFLIMMSMNEVLKYAQSVSLANKAAYAQWFLSQKSSYKSQEECQTATRYVCSYEQCDYVPAGEQFEEVCGKDFTKGWRPTTVVIPEQIQSVTAIRLSVGSSESDRTYTIEPRTGMMRFTLTGSEMPSQERNIQSHDITLLLNSFIYYDFIGLSQLLGSSDQLPNDRITIAFDSPTSGEQTTTYSVSCATSDCPRSIIDLKNDILRLWGTESVPALP